MKGDYVIAKAFGNKPLVRRVWESTTETVYICTDARYTELLEGEQGCYPIGFPRRCVFEYDISLASDLEKEWQTNPGLWDDLKLWQGDKYYAKEE